MQLSVLLVEDEPIVSRFCSLTLMQEGHSVVQVTNGREALIALEGAKFDLVITDLVMPDMDGLELIRKIRKPHPGLRIIAISGKFHGAFLKAAELLGAKATLPKPFTKENLLGVMEKIFSDNGG
jgi:CheY-like chemotaxis protein